MILDSPGAVVATSTRPDNLAATRNARQRVGPVAVSTPSSSPSACPAGGVVPGPRLRTAADRD